MEKKYIEEEYDIIVVGAGHAGCEAALAASRLGLETILFTISMDSVALMPCNPNVGGSSKGHLVREIDALGGEMGKNIDKTYIQSKMLNVSKGPAVHSLRAQADKGEYTKQMRLTLQNQEHLTLRQGEVAELLYDTKITDEMKDQKIICGVRMYSGAVYHAKAVILCTGTYLKARCIYGDVVNYTGPNGLSAANHLSDSMRDAGIFIRRFKTGTPARLDKKTIDFTKMQEQKGDEHIVPFSFTNKEEDIKRDQISCWLTYTNEETHKIIKDNIDRSPLFSGFIEGTGPRYCPSIEDKVMKFPDKDRHQLFIEPEGEFTNEMYMGGMSVGAGKYRKQYELVRDNLMAYAKKCHADFRFIDDYIDKDKKRDIYSQKLLIPDYLREYEQVLFLDLDIIISPDCPDIFALMPENIGLMAEVNPRSSARFRKIYADNERILNETVEDYFTSRGFAAADGLVGNINGGVLLFRPRLVADLFRDYYMSMKSQGENTAFEEAPMAYYTQTKGLFLELDYRFNCMPYFEIGNPYADRLYALHQNRLYRACPKPAYGREAYAASRCALQADSPPV